MQRSRKKITRPRVAFIDNQINRSYIKTLLKKEQRIVDVLTVSNQQVVQDQRAINNNLSHATLCSKIFLNQVTCGCELFYLNIWDEGETNANIDALLCALIWCLENDIHLVNLSLGTTRLSDASKLLTIVNQLADNNIIIIAASSNQQKLTFPAAFDKIIGVKAIPETQKRKSGFVYHDNSIDRIKISCYVPNESLMYKEEYYYLGTSNSFAAAIISAKICDLLSEGFRSLDELKIKLKNQALIKIPKQVHKAYRLYFRSTIEIPIIAIVNDSSSQIAKKLNEYFLKHEYQGMCLSENLGTNFSTRMLNIADFKYYSPRKILQFYAHYCYADYMIIESSEKLFKQLKTKEIDLVLHHSSFNILKIKRKVTCISYSDYEDYTTLFSEIYRYLSV